MAVGHHHVDAHREQILAAQAAPHPVLIGVHDDRVVVVDEQRLDRRRQRRARCRWRPTSTMLRVRVPGGTRSGRASFAGVLGNANAAPLTRPPPGTARTCRPARAARTPRGCRCRRSVALEPVAHGDRRPARSWRTTRRSCAHVRPPPRPHVSAAPLDRPRPRQRHELLEAAHVPLDERAVEAHRGARARRPPPTPAPRRCPGAAPGADRPARRSWCARGSTTTSLPPARRAVLMSGVMCRFDHVTLLPHATISLRGLDLLGLDARSPCRRCRSTPRCGCRRTAACGRAGWRRAGGRSAGPSSRRRAARAARHSSAAGPPAGRARR